MRLGPAKHRPFAREMSTASARSARLTWEDRRPRPTYPVDECLSSAENGFCQPHRLCYFLGVEVVLRKVGRKPGRAVVGRLLRAPRKGSVLVIEFPDGLHEYVTTPVKRILRLCGRDIYYLQTANSRYRLEIRSGDAVALEAPAAR